MKFVEWAAFAYHTKPVTLVNQAGPTYPTNCIVRRSSPTPVSELHHFCTSTYIPKRPRGKYDPIIVERYVYLNPVMSTRISLTFLYTAGSAWRVHMARIQQILDED